MSRHSRQSAVPTANLNVVRRHYCDLDGFRAIAALAIVCMHVQVRGGYVHANQWLVDLVSPWGTFVTLFFIISGFGMCCGYYERVKNQTIDLATFYTRRIMKILPFFALLVCIDVVSERFSGNSLWEAFADLTLVFNLMPDLDIQVIGVGWALGVIFLFYFLFPFFVYLMGNRRRAWCTFVISTVLSLSCVFHFFKADGHIDDRRFIYQAMFFVAGGLLYLYRDVIACMGRGGRITTLIVALAVVPLLYTDVPAWASNIKQLVLWIPWMVYAISGDHRMFDNRVMTFLSGISMEIYLSHLFIFQVVNMLGFTHLFASDTASYLVTMVFVVVGVILFATVAHKSIAKATVWITVHSTARQTVVSNENNKESAR